MNIPWMNLPFFALVGVEALLVFATVRIIWSDGLLWIVEALVLDAADYIVYAINGT